MTFIPSPAKFLSFALKPLLGIGADKPTWRYDRRILEAVLAFKCDLTYEPFKLRYTILVAAWHKFTY